MKRANRLIIGGLVLLVIGVGVAWRVGTSGDDSPPPSPVAVVVAKADLSPGEAGADLLAAGKVAVERVPESDVSPGALRSTDELAGTIVSSPLAEGAQIDAGALRSAVLRGSAIDIPDGLQAIAVTVPFTAGAAGYAGPGDHVNLYVTIPPTATGAPASPYTQLLLSDVELLDVSDEVAPRRAEVVTATEGTAPPTQTPRTDGEQLTLLLALDAGQAEQVVFAASVNELWFSLVPDDQGPSETPGVSYDKGYLEAEGP